MAHDSRPGRSALLEFELEKVVRGFFAPELLLDYLRYFVLFEDTDAGIIKKSPLIISFTRFGKQ
jgi:type I site-specific restriction-modification system R (restriction) subunit